MRRAHKLLVTTLVIGASALVISWNTTAEAGKPAMGVADAKRDASLLADKPLAVRGTVVEGTILMDGNRVTSFVLADGSEQLFVTYGRAPPDNFGPKDVVVNGILHVGDDGAVTMAGESIQVGCSSKY